MSAAEKMKEQGFSIVDMSRDIIAWGKYGLPVVK